MDVDYGSLKSHPNAERPIPQSYWIVATILLAWGLGYAVLIAEALFVMRPQDFDRMVSAGMILPGYSDYVQNLPQWIVGLTVFKGFTRLAGSLGLLLRRRWAVTMYILSLAASCVIFFRGFLMDHRASFEPPTQIGLDFVFFVLGIYALYFAVAATLRGLLR